MKRSSLNEAAALKNQGGWVFPADLLQPLCVAHKPGPHIHSLLGQQCPLGTEETKPSVHYTSPAHSCSQGAERKRHALERPALHRGRQQSALSNPTRETSRRQDRNFIPFTLGPH